MKHAPHVIRVARSGFKLGQSPQLEDSIWEALVDSYVGCGMAITAENLAEKYGITREEVDAYALRSQTAARLAQQNGWLAEEIVPVTVKDRKGIRLRSHRTRASGIPLWRRWQSFLRVSAKVV